MDHLAELMMLMIYVAFGALVGLATLPWKEGSTATWLFGWALAWPLLIAFYIKEGVVKYHQKYSDYLGKQRYLAAHPQKEEDPLDAANRIMRERHRMVRNTYCK